MNMPSDSSVKKCVAWGKATVYEFAAGHGGSTVPKSGGPAVGLAGNPTKTWIVEVGCSNSQMHGKVHRLTAQERINILQNAGFSTAAIQKFTNEAHRIVRSRKLNSKKAEKEREMKQLEQVFLATIRNDLVNQLEHEANLMPLTCTGKRKLEVVSIQTEEVYIKPKVQKTDRLALLYDIFASECQSSIVVI
ncbi:hypothetical protein THRCLA_03648 [Thraustotheca clavata]|uniref:Uncharacterized protein n=1 Tax=Thraustotheca clavata TaxID=74557 RepID=A0A1W0A1E6_9STRA|nr:hypothetical protein THRCLA_03648 [Thraustotheca clavata]